MKNQLRVVKTLKGVIGSLVFLLSSACSRDQPKDYSAGQQPYPEEVNAIIGRGLIALPRDQNQIFLSWRLLPSDPADVSFEVYRKRAGDDTHRPELIAETNLTSHVDSDVQEGPTYSYEVRPAHPRNRELFPGEATVTAGKGRNALVFDLGQEHKFARVVTGDLNGDGELEVVVAYANSERLDPTERQFGKKPDDSIKVAAFLRSGKRLWTMDLGWGIEVGAVYAPIVVWDIDADGREEVLLKTNSSSNPDDLDHERLTILDGATGNVRQEARWPRPIGDNYSNTSRNFLAIAHLDGKTPSIIVARGLYDAQRIWAYDSDLERQWERIIGDNHRSRLRRLVGRAGSDPGRLRGSHSLPVADVNNDGKEEILWGEHCIGQHGEDLWVIDERVPYNGHPDIVFAADISPAHEGKEIFYCREGWNGEDENIGMLLASSTGKILWARWGYTHIDGGWVGKIAPDDDGMQSYGFDVQKKQWNETGTAYVGVSHFLWSSDGEPLALSSERSWKWSFPLDWDGDEVMEICAYDGDVVKYNGPVVAQLGAFSGNVWKADLFGDHREEIVVSGGEREGGKVFIYFNTELLANTPRLTRIADRQYKNDLSRTAMQFNVVPTEGGYIPKRSSPKVAAAR